MSSSRKKSERQGSTSSQRTSTSRSSRQGSTTKQGSGSGPLRAERKPTLKDLEDVLYEIDVHGGTEVPLDSPPPYQARPPQERAPDIAPKPPKPTEKSRTGSASRILWPMAMGVPLLVAGGLMFFATCSDSYWRSKLSNISIKVSTDIFEALTEAAGKLEDDNDQSSNTQTRRAEVMAAVGLPANSTIAGSLMLDMWGWCLSPSDDTSPTCSDLSPFGAVKELVETAALSSGTFTATAFGTALINGLVMNGFAMIFVLLAVVAVGLYCWRRYHKRDDMAEAGWFQHGSLIVGGMMCTIAYILDRSLVNNLSSNLKGYTVITGPGSIITGTSALLVSISFVLTFVPSMRRKLKRRRQSVRRFNDMGDLEREVQGGVTLDEVSEVIERGEHRGFGGRKGRKSHTLDSADQEEEKTRRSRRDKHRQRRRHGTR